MTRAKTIEPFVETHSALAQWGYVTRQTPAGVIGMRRRHLAGNIRPTKVNHHHLKTNGWIFKIFTFLKSAEKSG